jgi:hypothetical protein
LGSNKNKDLTLADIITYFKNHTKFSKPNEVLDYLVLTHGDSDHYNMISEFQKSLKFTITNLLFGGKESDYRRLISDLTKAQRKAGKPITVLKSAGIYPYNLAPADSFGGVSVKVMIMNVPGTHKKTPAWRKNTASVVLRLEYGGVGVLLSGDATTDTERYTVTMLTGSSDLGQLQSAILKVGHHGSARTSISEKWIKAIKPKYIFISSDRSGASGPRKKERTGHRLPQQLAIDIITANTVLEDMVEHTYVSSYDPDDYKKHKDPDTRAGFANPHTGDWAKTRCWQEFKTSKAIFTTLVAMDRNYPDESEADQGAQFGLTISDKGEIDVASTYEDDEDDE